MPQDLSKSISLFREAMREENIEEMVIQRVIYRAAYGRPFLNEDENELPFKDDVVEAPDDFHSAEDCPERIEHQTYGGNEPQYMHGDCGAPLLRGYEKWS